MTGPGAPSWRAVRSDVALLAVVTAAATVPRVVWRGSGLFDIDSALLALGVRDYGFAASHPHPPFHPLTVAAAKVLAPWTGAADALVWLSLLATAALAASVYCIGRMLGGRAVGAYAGVLVALSPLVTANSGVALSYVNEAAAVAGVALAALHARRRRSRPAWLVLGLAASFAVGVRPSAALAAGVLALWAVGRDARALATTAAAGVAATLAWLVPTLWAGGGWADFQFGNQYQSRFYVFRDTALHGRWDAVHNHLAWLTHHFAAEGSWLLAAGGLAVVAGLPLWQRRGPDDGVLAAWAVPNLLFYGLVYSGWPTYHSGYALTLLGPAFVGGALALRRLHGVARDAGGFPAVGLTVLIVAVALLPTQWVSATGPALEDRHRVAAWEASWVGLEAELPANRTALFGTYEGYWALVEHDEYLTWIVEAVGDLDGGGRFQVQENQHGRADKAMFDNIRDGADDARHPVPPWVEEIAVLSGHPLNGWSIEPAVPVKRVVTLPGGARVDVLDARDIRFVEDLVPGFGTIYYGTPARVWP